MSVRQTAFSDLPGWDADDHGAALDAFLRHCSPRPDVEPRHSPALCAAARAASLAPSAERGAAARRFFEDWFRPVRIRETGFLTGYFEPEFEGSLVRDARHQVPLLARPPELVAVDDASRPDGFPQGFPFAMRAKDGTLSLPPDRGEIMDGALSGRGLELVWLADPVDAFYVHVQGSARIRLAGGGVLRVGYAGKTGHPYSPIGRVMIERGLAEPGTVTMQVLRGWLADNPQEVDAVLRRNRSYIFFRKIEAGEDEGPVGGAGLPLVAGRSLAVDASRLAYGTPVFVSATLPLGEDGALQPFRRLMLADDTGSAIVGDGRGDIFVGSGHEAGQAAGRIQHRGTLFVLEPREEGR
jgi:membrane-bound lytic murein transglycosylase A